MKDHSYNDSANSVAVASEIAPTPPTTNGPKFRKYIIASLIVVLFLVGIPGGWLLYVKIKGGEEKYWCQALQPVFYSYTPFSSQRYNETCRVVWAKVQVPVSQPVNFLKFSLQFTSDPGAKGILTISFDGDTVATIKEEETSEEVQEILLPIENKSQGEYELAFRLVPTTKNKSAIALKDAQVGFDPRLFPTSAKEIPADARVLANLEKVYDSARFSPDKSQVIVQSVDESRQIDYIPSGCEACVRYDRIVDADYVETPSGQELYFIGQKSEQIYFVYRGETTGPLEFTRSIDPVFDKNGVNYAFAGLRNNSIIIVKNGEEIVTFNRQDNNPRIAELTLSPNGERLAYTVIRGNGKESSTTVSITGEVEQTFESAGGLQFSPDSQHYMYTAKDETEAFVVFDGKRNQTYTELSPQSLPYPPVRFSADGSTTIYVGVRGYRLVDEDSTAHLIVNGKEVTSHADIQAERISSVGNVVAYIGIDPDPQQPGNFVYGIYVNGEKKYHHSFPQDIFRRRVSQLTLSPDGTSIAYVIEHAKDKVTVMLDGRPQTTYQTTYQDISYLQFSPDGKSLAYNAIGQDLRPLVVLDGKELPGYSPYRPFAFSPDSQHFAYWSSPLRKKYPFQQVGDDTASFKGQSYVVVDDSPGPLFDDVYDGNFEAFAFLPGIPGVRLPNTITFSEDSSQVIYNAQQGNALLEVKAKVN